MSTYINAKLMRIDDDRLVVIDGVKYLVMDETKVKNVKVAQKSKIKPLKRPVKKSAKKYPFLAEAETAILTILRNRPNLRSSALRTLLKEDFNLEPPVGALSSLCARMKKDGQLEVNGTKANATWALKKKEPEFHLNISQQTQGL